MRNILVVHRCEQWPSSDVVEIVNRRTYLRDPRFVAKDRTVRVVNLSRDFGYQTLGYYVSLLADARRHRVIPTASLSQDIKNRRFLEAIDDELTPSLKRPLGQTKNKVVLRVELGQTDQPETEELGRKLFRLLPIPIFEATFRRRDEELVLSRIQILGDGDLTPAARTRALSRVEKHLKTRSRPVKARTYRFDMAILHDAGARESPSNPGALQKFQDAAESLGIRAELVTREDYARLPEFDGLFIRETTAVNHHTYRFARRAQAEGIIVIDDPDSILRCTNKVFLAELMAGYKIPHPPTRIITKEEVDDAAFRATFPAVLKRPDGAFSLGMFKVKSADEYRVRAKELLEDSELILSQPFLKSDYDWRIGIIDGEPIFACRYFMAKGHWQVIQHEGSQSSEGEHETVAIETAPAHVVRTARAAARLIGDGLYGVDLKDIDGQAYVIEVNDNPNIDVGVEDQVLKDQLYRRIMETFLSRMEKRTARRGDSS